MMMGGRKKILICNRGSWLSLSLTFSLLLFLLRASTRVRRSTHLCTCTFNALSVPPIPSSPRRQSAPRWREDDVLPSNIQFVLIGSAIKREINVIREQFRTKKELESEKLLWRRQNATFCQITCFFLSFQTDGGGGGRKKGGYSIHRQ